jgi:prevent-host-death family protein
VKTVDVGAATATLAEYADAAAEDPIVLTRRGKPIAAVIPLRGDLDLESLSLSTNPDFMAILQRSRDSLRRHGGIGSEEMRRRVEEMNRPDGTANTE